MGKEIFAWIRDHHLLGVSILGISIAVASTIFVTRPQEAPRLVEEKAWPVSVIESEPTRLAPNLVAYGKIESRQVANLKTSVVAPVLEVLAYEGKSVKKGDLLVLLDSKELELAKEIANSEFEQQRASLESVKNDFELATQLTRHYQELKAIKDAKLKRHLNLFSNKMVSDAIVDEVRQQASQQAIVLAQHLSSLKDFPNRIRREQAEVDKHKANLDQASLDLAQTRITAPFNGRIIKTFVAPGDRILPGVPLIQVADQDGVEVRASVSAKIGGVLRQQLAGGESLKAVGEIDGISMAFTLNRVSGDVKPGQSGLDVFFTPKFGSSLDIGRVVSLTVTLPAENDLVILPIQSIYENDRIYRVEENRLVGLRVEEVGDYIDAKGNFRVLVRSDDIVKGDILVTTQLPRAITGLLVEPIDAAELDKEIALQ